MDNGDLVDAAAALLPADGVVLTNGSDDCVAALVAARAAGKRPRVAVALAASAEAASGALATLAAGGLAAEALDARAVAAAVRELPARAVLVGATRVAANGDLRAPLGTYGLALAAAQHGVPLYALARRDQVDLALRRDDAPRGEGDDVTPGHLVAAVVTPFGPLRPPYEESLPDLATRPRLENLTPAQP